MARAFGRHFYRRLTWPNLSVNDSVVGTFAAERAAKLRGQAAGLSTHQVLSEPITVRSETYRGMG